MQTNSLIFVIAILASTISDGYGQVSTQSKESPSKAELELQFNRDIRPILSDRCFLCHGPDQSSEVAKETSLRLDQRESALEYGAINLDDVESSSILERVHSDDESDQMPPPHSGKKPLGKEEIELLRNWIKQGAKYEKHWAFVPPQRPTVPEVSQKELVKNPIDAFVLHQLDSKKMSPSAAASRTVLIRRASFDLIGLPPTIDEIDAFVNDPNSDDKAFEKVVDRLLASPHYGEHMARSWLDAARYADTSGYQYDKERTQWVWRDWVIHAFNTNKPFDQFAIEQIAGDMLPDATDQTRLATGFNRNHPITIEGGVVDEEYRTEYVIDRVVTTSTVFMGQTFLCARCHDHKYDPISQKDFYQFYAFFNNVPEKGLNGFEPKEKINSPLSRQAVADLQQQLNTIESKITALDLPTHQWIKSVDQEKESWKSAKPLKINTTAGSTVRELDDGSILIEGKKPAKEDYELIFDVTESVAAIRLDALLHESLLDKSGNKTTSRSNSGNFVLTEFIVETKAPKANKWNAVKIESGSADHAQPGYPLQKAFDGKVKRSGWSVEGHVRKENRNASFNLSRPVQPGEQMRIKLLQRFGRSHQIGRLKISFSGTRPLPRKIQQLLADHQDAKEQSDNKPGVSLVPFELTKFLIGKYGKGQPLELLQNYQRVDDKLTSLTNYPETMVMEERETAREAFVLDRGEYDKPRKDEPVQPGVPIAMGSLEGYPQNRLGLAQWLVSKEQPLTARVTVNRFWQRIFGVGLVKTSEDFGSQGEFPSNPELLDWLAVDFMESGWDVKRILKLIVMSNSYRQSSRLTPELLELDPENRLIGRGPRVRLEGEVIRDSALAVSGLLIQKIGGASVYPYHPKGLWLEINNRPGYSRAYPQKTTPDNLYRRSMYSFWKRTVTPPSAGAFDAPSREYCVMRRSQTNTPLQAFVMMHDPQFVEAARVLAERMLLDGGDTSESQIKHGFRICTSREPTKKELAILVATLKQKQVLYEGDAAGVETLLSVGQSTPDKSLNRVELAAMAQVARLIMNLSEFLTNS